MMCNGIIARVPLLFGDAICLLIHRTLHWRLPISNGMDGRPQGQAGMLYFWGVEESLQLIGERLISIYQRFMQTIDH